MSNLSAATREIMWNISGAWVMYALFVAAMAVFGFGMYRRLKGYLSGKADRERLGDFGRRAWYVVKELALQRRVRNDRFPGYFHSLILYSFVVLVITTAVVAMDYDFGTSFFSGWLYVVLTVGAELAGLFILVGIGMAVWRRYVTRPKSLETGIMDTWALGMIAFIILTGFVIEGLRLATNPDPWVFLSPIGWLFALPFAGISESAARLAHAIFWWTHTVAAMAWIATIPYTKFFHLVALPANLFFAKLGPRGALARVDLEEMMMAEDFDEDNFKVGTERVEDLTWKQRLDFDSCISCGRCEAICPVTLSGVDFSPKKFIASLRDLVKTSDEALRAAKANPAPTQSVGAALAATSPQIVGGAFDEEYIWLCRTCTACMEVCPAAVDHVDTLVDIRRNESVIQGRIPNEAARALRMLERTGNPFGQQEDRIQWIKDLNLRVVERGESCDVLYWIGCCTTFDPTKQKIGRDLCELLKRAGVDFGVLGAEETCCGDPARLMGQEHVFQTIAKQTVEAIKARDFKVLLVSCPHCYNVLAHEYKSFGADFHVAHHAEFLHEMIWRGVLVPEFGEKRKAVYHDPCYLGRYQKIYDPPREVIKAVPGNEILEMKNHRDKSLCCGGGGGHFWMDIKKGERINNLRVDQAREAGADTIVTSCAFCMQMIDDSVKLLDMEESMRVVDLATMILESLPPEEERV